MRKTVLIVDDAPDILEIATIALRDVGGHEVRTATNGEEALASVRAARPDAVLLDVSMPVLDGPGTVRALRDEGYHDLAIVFLTASARRAEHARLRDLGVQGVLTKPFEPMTLADQLARMLAWTP
ncbi:MAG: response regulator [Acidimicrobiia bacterium]|jgi:CheY-like chemotaxis protein